MALHGIAAGAAGEVVEAGEDFLTLMHDPHVFGTGVCPLAPGQT